MTRKNTGFTLVEILIVVIILGILAAIVIPQFTEASQDARNSALSSDLQTMRSQIELYKVQHLDKYPSDLATVTDSATFIGQLTVKTNQDGTLSGGTLNLGPYLQKFPTNAFVTGDPGSAVTIGTGVPTGCTTGWWFDKTAGKMYAGDTAHSGL